MDPRDWERLLGRALERPVRVRYGRARREVIHARPASGAAGAPLEVRMSAFFASAPPDVADAVARWLRSGSRAHRATELLDAWIEEQVEALPPPRRRARARGAAHDLARLARLLRDDEFGGRAGRALLPPERWPPIGWGRRGRSRARHTLQLGCYDFRAREIRIHPVLDQPAVPEWFVRFLVFHELLHVALPPVHGDDGSSRHHGPDFRRHERAHPDHARAKRWQRAHIGALLRSARSGEPLPATGGRSARHERGRNGWIQRLLF